MTLGPKKIYSGVVKRQPWAVGSKSEHEAIVLDTGNGPALKIRVTGQNPFYDPALEPFVGKRVNIKGVVPSGSVATILVDDVADIAVIPPNKSLQRPPKP